ncbi:MAG: DUF1579 domain-containing protein [Planctomycetales bacterium]|nr:DUF1579 domain-containing protein [Planctomycetales bacterium]
MFAKPQSEHEWFQPLLGDWDFAHECDGPDGSTQSARGTVRATTFGGLWYLLECNGVSPEGDPWTSLFSLGYDPTKQRYVGTFIASMMTHLWVYEGKLDEQQRLVLNVEGPKFDGTGMTQYQDEIEIASPDHWILRSRMQLDDGQWQQFMEGHHHRLTK